MSTKDEHDRGEVALYRSPAGDVSLEVRLEHDSVWLTQRQMAELFGRAQSVISRHLRRALTADELSPESTMQKAHIAGSDNTVVLYNLDAVISVGYRVNSARGTQFRIWATRTLRDHVLRGTPLERGRGRVMLDAAEIRREAARDGWRPEPFEKVARLPDLLVGLRAHPFPRPQALKEPRV